MGPRPFGRGRRHCCACLVRRDLLQWGRDLSAAEGSSPSCAPPSRATCFNGAATFRPRKVPSKVQSAKENLRASMGPRPFGRGRVIRRFSRSRGIAGFNGAATFRPRKAVVVGEIVPAGQASMGPRPFGRGRHSGGAEGGQAGQLQWGRDLSAAEGRRPASRSARRCGFNGAATFRPRKAGRRARRNDVGPASMGPRPFGRGRKWRGGAAPLAMHASMGPRPFGRGRSARTREYSTSACFNGAATFRPRKVGIQTESNVGGQVLQWGRDLSAAEGGRCRRDVCSH